MNLLNQGILAIKLGWGSTFACLPIKFKIMQNRLLGSTWMQLSANWSYHKIPKISPGAYIFQRPFLRGLYVWRGLSRREICISKLIGLDLWLEGNLPLFHVFIWGQFPSTSPQWGLYLEEQFNEGFFALPIWGAYICRDLYMEGLIFGILRYSISTCHHHHHHHYQGSLSWAEPMAYPVCLIFHRAENSLVHEVSIPLIRVTCYHA